MARHLIAHFQQAPAPAPASRTPLSPKEHQILQRLADGDTYEAAAKKLHMTTDLLRYYIKKIYKTLGVENKGAAVKKYLDMTR